MAFAVNSTKNLLDRFNDLHNLRDIVLLAGLYYTSKFTLKTVGSIWSAIKTFGLPLIWPRNFKEEYGLWAGDYKINTSQYWVCTCLKKANLKNQWFKLVVYEINHSWF